MVLNAEQHRQRRALQKYARNAAGKLVRAAAFRACDYTEAGLLREFSTEDAVLTFELDRYNDGSGYQPRATVPQEQLALQAALEQAVEEDGNQTRLQSTSVEEGLHARLDDISQRVDALRQQNPPATSALASPGDLQLMARVQKSSNVARDDLAPKALRSASPAPKSQRSTASTVSTASTAWHSWWAGEQASSILKLLYSLSTATCRAYKVPLTSSLQPLYSHL